MFCVLNFTFQIGHAFVLGVSALKATSEVTTKVQVHFKDFDI